MAARKRPYTKGIRGKDQSTRDEWGGRLRAAREGRGMSQAALAERVGVTRSSVSAWERGVTSPTAEARKLVARALRTKIENVFPVAA